MTFRPEYDIPLAYGGNTVWLRPSLRAATRLEALHSGFPALLSKSQQHDTATLRAIITHAATDQDAAQALLNSMAGEPLRDIQHAALGPALALVTALMMPTPDAEPSLGPDAPQRTSLASIHHRAKATATTPSPFSEPASTTSGTGSDQIPSTPSKHGAG